VLGSADGSRAESGCGSAKHSPPPSPPVIRRLLITEQSSLAELHAILRVSFGWSDKHGYSFQFCGWQFGEPARAIELALAGGGVDIPLAALAESAIQPSMCPAAPPFPPAPLSRPRLRRSGPADPVSGNMPDPFVNTTIPRLSGNWYAGYDPIPTTKCSWRASAAAPPASTLRY